MIGPSVRLLNQTILPAICFPTLARSLSVKRPCGAKSVSTNELASTDALKQVGLAIFKKHEAT